jgi:hypothetical protein
MCGELNPDHLELCQFCEARLRPLIAPSPDSEEPSGPESMRGSSEDWLHEFDGSEEEGGGEALGDFEDDLPDWLGTEPAEESAPPEETSAEGNWLDNMRPDNAEQDSSDEDWLASSGWESEEELDDSGPFDLDDPEEESDWLSGMRPAQEEPAEEDSPDEPPLPEPSDEPSEESVERVFSEQPTLPMSKPDFDLVEGEADLSDEDPDPSESSEPDWLSELGSLEDAVELPDSSLDSLSDWFSEDADPADTPLPEVVKPPEGWMEELTGGEGLPEPDESAPGELPDWLTDVGTDSGVDLPAAESLPEWLEEPEAAPKSELTPDESSPDWLANLAADASEEEDEEPAAQPAEEVPDWLAEPADEAPEELPLPDAVDETPLAEDASSPEWLSELVSEDLPAAEPAEDVPEWLANFASEEMAAAEGEDTAVADAPDWLDSFAEEVGEDSSENLIPGELPEWMRDIQARESAPADEEVPGEADWLDAVEEADPAEQSQPGNMMDWDFDTGEAVSEEEPEEEIEWFTQEETPAMGLFSGEDADTGQEDLAPGDLPEWLKSMRPDQFDEDGAIVVSEYEGGEVERAGPLSGLRGLLTPAPDVGVFNKPPAYSVRLKVTEVQQKQTDLLRNLVEQETLPKEIERKPVLSQQRVLRWIIAAVLLLAALLPVLSGTQLIPLAGLPQEAVALPGMINQLGESAPVLLVFDYQPALAGELDAAAAAVVDHLMLRGARLALVSTTPTGAALGEHFVDTIERAHNYQPGEQYVNLGFISGDITGVQNFSIDPRQVAPRAFDDQPLWQFLLSPTGSDPWSQPPLAGVNSLRDFELTIVITDDPESARMWVEQVEPALRDRSLAMIVSAQAEPLVRPYYTQSGRQVNALVTGLAGGAAYEQAIGRPNLSRTYWDAYGLSILAGLLLIIGAGFYNLVEVWRTGEARRKR